MQRTRKEKWVEISKALDWFTKRMEFKLKVHDRKPFWRDENGFDIYQARKRLSEELSELDYALGDYNFYPNNDMAQAVIHECADVANFAMMIADMLYVGHEDEEGGTVDGTQADTV